MLEILRSCGIDETCARREIAAVQQLGGRDRHRARVAHIAIGVGERELHRFDLQMLHLD
jgi:hypothetical protein